MLKKIILALFVCISPIFTDDIFKLPEFRLGTWEAKTNYTFPNSDEKLSLEFKSFSYLSKNKKIKITKGRYWSEDFNTNYLSKFSFKPQEDGTYRYIYEDEEGEATYSFKVIKKHHYSSTDDVSGNVDEWTVEQVDENTFKSTGIYKTADGQVINSWVSISKYLGKEEQ